MQTLLFRDLEELTQIGDRENKGKVEFAVSANGVHVFFIV